MNNKDKQKNNIEIITYSVLGGILILYLMPSYIPYAICYSGIIFSLYWILNILKKYDNSNDFVSKEDIEYFKK